MSPQALNSYMHACGLPCAVAPPRSGPSSRGSDPSGQVIQVSLISQLPRQLPGVGVFTIVGVLGTLRTRTHSGVLTL